jgi:hypothetical protein
MVGAGNSSSDMGVVFFVVAGISFVGGVFAFFLMRRK